VLVLERTANQKITSLILFFGSFAVNKPGSSPTLHSFSDETYPLLKKKWQQNSTLLR